MSNKTKKLYFADGQFARGEGNASSGVRIEFDSKTQKLSISSWYDSVVGTDPTSIDVDEFINALGISPGDAFLSRFGPSLRGARK